MKTFKNLTLKINETNKQIEDVKRKLSIDPSNRAMKLTLVSLESFLNGLKNESIAILNSQEENVIDYKLISDDITNKGLPIKDFYNVFYCFQKLFSFVFDTVFHNKPKNSQHLSKDIMAKSELRLRYAYSGSLGVILSVYNDGGMIDTDIDKAILETSKLMILNQESEINKAIEKLGYAPIKALENLVQIHMQSDVELDINFSSSKEGKIGIRIKKDQFSVINNLIERTPIVITDTDRNLQGNLLGMDIQKRTFNINLGNRHISGSLDDSISEGYIIGNEYLFDVEKITTTINGSSKDKFKLLKISDKFESFDL